MTSTFILHCEKFYNAIDEVSTDIEADGKTVRRFAGKITEVWKSTGIAQTYYTPVTKCLERHSAILRVQTGGRNADTVFILNGLPDQWEVDGWKGESSVLTQSGLTVGQKHDKLDKRLDDLETSLGGINVLKALESMETRLKALEAQIILMTPVTRKKRNQEQS